MYKNYIIASKIPKTYRIERGNVANAGHCYELLIKIAINTYSNLTALYCFYFLTKIII